MNHHRVFVTNFCLIIGVLTFAADSLAFTTREECILTVQSAIAADVPGANPNSTSGIKAHLAAIAPECPSDVMSAYYQQEQLELQRQQMQMQQIQRNTVCTPTGNGGFSCNNGEVGF